MGWASYYIDNLKEGRTVEFRPRGTSMIGRITSGQLCTVIPITGITLEVNDIVLCRVGGNEYLHLIKDIQGDRYQIGNNRGGINGWASINAIYGKCIKII